MLTPFRYQDDLTVRRLHSFLGCESECIVVRTYDVQLDEAEQEPPARRQSFRPHVEADRPRGSGKSGAKHTALRADVKLGDLPALHLRAGSDLDGPPRVG